LVDVDEMICQYYNIESDDNEDEDNDVDDQVTAL